MGKYTSIIIGAVVVLFGLWGLKSWWGEFIMIVKGSVPIMVIFGGIIAVIAGLTEMKDEAAAKKEETK